MTNMTKIKAEMAEHWDMTGEEFDTFTHTETFGDTSNWHEMVFENGKGKSFFIEVNANSDVWNFDWC